MLGLGSTTATRQIEYATAAASSSVTASIAADPDQRWVIDKIIAGYDTAPAANRELTIEFADSTVAVFVVPGTTGYVALDFPDGIFQAGVNEKVEAILEASSGDVPHVTVFYR